MSTSYFNSNCWDTLQQQKSETCTVMKIDIPKSTDLGGFHLHLQVYPFIYQFYTRMTVLIETTFWNHAELFIFTLFQNILPKTRGSFYLLSLQSYSKLTTELINKQTFELPFELPFYLQIEIEVNLLDQNLNGLGFELSRMQMKPAHILESGHSMNF